MCYLSISSLDKDIILDATEKVIQRFGSDKANISDVAKSLKVTHATIYRYFDNKLALWNAVTQRWLERIFEPMELILNTDMLPEKKLYLWLKELSQSKRQSAFNDPEMFSVYTALAADSGEVLKEHVDYLINQLEKIILEGKEKGIFDIDDSYQTAKSIFLSMSRFHHPTFLSEWYSSDVDQNFESIYILIFNGLKAH